MGRKDDRPIDLRWQAAAAVLFLLLALGILLPFWMEFKSLSAPVHGRPARGGRAMSFDSRKPYYCPACGATVSVPQWDDTWVLGVRRAELKLESLAPAAWEIPLASTGLSRPVPQTTLDKGGSP